ncbi:MAG: M24 family metallopeptidase [Candidatus Hydrothermarchaeaceae archaeon]
MESISSLDTKAGVTLAFVGAFLGMGKKSIGIEGDFLGVGFLEALGVEKYANISPTIARLRSIKDKEEIKNIERSVKISEKAMEEVFHEIEEGKSEKEISGFFDYAAKHGGAGETKARVMVGKNTSKPFQWLSGEVIKEGPLMIDYGTTWKKYWTDITRTFYLGKPARDFEEVYGAVVDAQKEGIKLAKAEEEIASVDVAVRGVLKEYGYEKYIVYASGHGCGLEHEEPPVITAEKGISEPYAHVPFAGDEMEELYKLAGAEKEVFKENMVMTLEPGLYLEKFGVRIEDMILIRKRAKVLSSFPKSLERVMI